MTVVGVAFLGFIMITVIAGLLAAHRGGEAAGDYLVSNRSLGILITSLSVSGTDVSGWVLMGLVGVAFKQGLSALWVLPAGLIGYVLLWGLVAQRIRRDSEALEVQTFPEFLAAGFDNRSSRWVRGVASLIILGFLSLYLSAQFNACGKAMRSFFGIPYELGALAGIPIMLPYVVVSGMRGVGWSEFVQALLIAVGVVLVPVIATERAGGFGGIYHSLSQADPSLISLTGGKFGFDALLLVTFWLAIGLGYPGQPQILTRFMAARDDQTLRRGRLISFGWFLLVASMSVLLGLAARASFAELPMIQADPEQILPVLAREFLSPVLVGLVLAAIVCAIMNSSMVFVLLSTLIADVPSLIGRRQRQYGLATRAVAGLFVVGTAAGMAVLGERSIFKVVLDAWAVLGASFAPAVLYRLWAPRPRVAAILAGMCAGATAAVSLNGYQQQILGSISISALALAVAHVATPNRTTRMPPEVGVGTPP